MVGAWVSVLAAGLRNAMRVVGGSLRGRALVAPKGSTTRPTGDRVREAMFSALEAMGVFSGVTAPRVFDLFAGSGALGIEAWSRGASQLTLVERDRHALVAIRGNLHSLGIAWSSRVVEASDRVAAVLASGAMSEAGSDAGSDARPGSGLVDPGTVVQASVRVAAFDLRSLMRRDAGLAVAPWWTGDGADVVLLDPPYRMASDLTPLLDALEACDALRPGALVVVEHARTLSEPLHGRWTARHEKTRHYGDTSVSFFALPS